MIELKVKDPQALMSVVDVFKSNGYEVKTYVQWAVGGEVRYFTVEVPGITIATPDKPRTWLARVLEHTHQYIGNLRRNEND